jgi:predicted nucleotidyltransferase component of viral defense system
MIDRDEIVNRAEELGIHTSNLQRDYVFGWVLAGIYSVSALKDHLILKGGNAFRKVYFEAARYSPDLDFATTRELPQEHIASELNRVCEFIKVNAGVQFVTERTRVERKRGVDSSKQVQEARLYFKDFFGETSQLIISIRLDVSQFERVFLPVQTRNLIHPYSDRVSCMAEVRCLKLEEMLAGKLKCLLQRRHSADLYDFVCATFINPSIEINKKEAVDAFLQMTIFGSGPGIVKELLVNLPFQIIRGLWQKHLVYPKDGAIDFDNAVDRFKLTVDSLFGSLPTWRGEFAFFPSHLRNPIMEAGHTLTRLRVVYDEIEREAEPYSLKYKTRKDGVSREYLYVYDLTGGKGSGPGLKSWVHQKIESIANTDVEFEPRAEVELSKAGEFFRERYFHGSPGPRLRRSFPGTMRSFSGTKYVFECSVCGKRFYRKKYNTKLKPHKDKYGNRCFGRTGLRV